MPAKGGLTQFVGAAGPQTRAEDYMIPDLKLSQQPEKPLGKSGRMRKTYLKEHHPILHNQMLLSEKLYPHLLEIDETAQNRLEPVSYTHLDVYKRQFLIWSPSEFTLEETFFSLL